MKAPGGGGVTLWIYFFINLSARWGEWLTSCLDRFTPSNDPVRIVWEAGWVPRPVRTGAEYLAPTGIRCPDRPPSNEFLYRLSHPGARFWRHCRINTHWLAIFLTVAVRRKNSDRKAAPFSSQHCPNKLVHIVSLFRFHFITTRQ